MLPTAQTQVAQAECQAGVNINFGEGQMALPSGDRFAIRMFNAFISAEPAASDPHM
jgi:hypothetical protein